MPYKFNPITSKLDLVNATTAPVTPGGSDTQLQYNNAGAFGGISGVTSDGSVMIQGLNTFLKGTLTDTSTVNLIGTTDAFGGDLVLIGDLVSGIPLTFGVGNGVDNTFANIDIDYFGLYSQSATESIQFVTDRLTANFQSQYSTPNAFSTGVVHEYNTFSGIPANSDVLHTFKYQGNNSALDTKDYAAVTITASDITATAEIGQYSIGVRDVGGLYAPVIITGAKRIDINLTAGATQYTALYDQASLSETFTDNSNNLTVLTQDTNQWELVAQDIGLSSFGTARIKYDGITLSLTDGFIAPVLKLDYNTPYFGLGDPGDFGMMLDISNNRLQFDGDTLFNSSVQMANNVYLRGADTLSNQVDLLGMSSTDEVFFGTDTYSNIIRGTGTTFLKESDGATGPNIDFYQFSNSPAANDEIGILNYYGQNSIGTKTKYADITGLIVSPTNGAESGGVIHYAALAGTRTEVMRWGNLDANFKGLAVGTVSPIDPSGSNVTRFQAYNSALNACVASIGGGEGSGNTLVIFSAGTTARQIRMGYISGYGLLDFVNMPASGALVRASNQSITYQCGTTHAMVWGAFGGAEFMRINATTGNMGVGTGSTVSARLHLIKTTLQQRTGYDVNNYFDTTVNSTGSVNFDLVGTTPSFNFLDPVNIQSSLQCDSIVNDTGLAHGTYTPTGTGVTNITTITPRQCQYMRVGNTVTVSGQVDIAPTANNTRTTFALSLPIASNFGNSYEAGGSGYTMANTVAGHGVAVYADATNNRLEFDYFETHGAGDTFTFTCTYLVI